MKNLNNNNKPKVERKNVFCFYLYKQKKKIDQ